MHDTQRKLFTALMNLCSEKMYKKISVLDIAERALIHRATFYRHFEDKNDLLSRGTLMLCDDIINAIDAKAVEESGNVLARIEVFFREIERHGPFFSELMKLPPAREIIEQQITLFIKESRIMPNLRLDVDAATADAVAAMTAAALTAMIMLFSSNTISAAAAAAEYYKFIVNALVPFLE